MRCNSHSSSSKSPVTAIAHRAGEPLLATAEGSTRDEAIANLRADLVARVASADIVRMTIPTPISMEPVWPDDDITRDWLEGIAAAPAAEDQQTRPAGCTIGGLANRR